MNNCFLDILDYIPFNYTPLPNFPPFFFLSSSFLFFFFIPGLTENSLGSHFSPALSLSLPFLSLVRASPAAPFLSLSPPQSLYPLCSIFLPLFFDFSLLNFLSLDFSHLFLSSAHPHPSLHAPCLSLQPQSFAKLTHPCLSSNTSLITSPPPCLAPSHNPYLSLSSCSLHPFPFACKPLPISHSFSFFHINPKPPIPIISPNPSETPLITLCFAYKIPHNEEN